MTANVLVLETFAEKYAKELRTKFEGLVVYPVTDMAGLKIDLSEIDVLIAFGISINDDIIRKAARLKWIQSLATGVDHFLRCPSLKPGIVLTSARGIHGPCMRETVAYLMLSLSRDTLRLARDQATRRWDRDKPWQLLARKCAVLAGTGVSGSAVGALLKAFGMRVIGVSRTPRMEKDFDDIVHIDRLADAAREADFVVNIMPGGPNNVNLFNRRVFEAMKRTAYFINVGRGESVDEAALIEALRAGGIAGAGLDVFRTAPLPADSPLWDMPGVLINPHIAGRFDEYENYVMPVILDNMRLFLAGRAGEMHNVVTHG
jgi:phosphoglycerate dehydrogenase-like enzyme